jgi:hypothetical protein
MQVCSALQRASIRTNPITSICITLLQVLNDDEDVQQLRQRRQNLMYQVAVLQLQQVSVGRQRNATALRISNYQNSIYS